MTFLDVLGLGVSPVSLSKRLPYPAVGSLLELSYDQHGKTDRNWL
jgi:hypothetical protein